MNICDINVDYIDHMGTDKTVVNAARISFNNDNNESLLNDKDHKLIAFLAKHNHWSPFAHTSIQLKIKAPIFVARQLVKHQVGASWNEVSRRYVDYEPEFWLPTILRGKPRNAKQGSDGVIDAEYISVISEVYQFSLDAYNTLLLANVAPEQARMVLPLGSITDWYWTGSLYFWARVVSLRSDSDAQEESQQVAKQINDICFKLFPISWQQLTLKL